MASFQNPNFRANLERHLGRMMRAAAIAASDQLRDNVSGQGRTGTHWPSLPFPSSAPGEFPTEQDGGRLVAASGFSQTRDRLVWRVGFFGPHMKQYEDIEFLPPKLGGRQPIAMTMEDEITHARMRQAMAVEAADTRSRQ